MPYCSNCGKELASGAKFCPNCGASQTSSQPQVSSTTSPKPRPSSGSRPFVITIMVFANFILGVGVVVLGVFFLLTPTQYVALAEALAAVLILLGILSVATGLGYRRARAWAWAPGLLTAVIYVGVGLLLTASGTYVLGIPSLILGIFTLYYLNTRPSKVYLGRK